jgi:hypothetical protein
MAVRSLRTPLGLISVCLRPAPPMPDEKNDPDAPARQAPPRVAAWERFYESVQESLEARPAVPPMPDYEDGGHPTVRIMQRARRHTWLHARHGLSWSMFESIRISVRLAEAFAGWTRGGAADMAGLARLLERVEKDARQIASASVELRFVDQLMDAATATDLPLAEMDLALEAFRRAELSPRRAAGE